MPRFVTLIFCLAGQAAGAQTIDCANAQNQLDVNQCAYQDWQSADDDLNAAYKAAMQLLKSWDAGAPVADQGAAAALREAQRAWITFRDNACAAEGFAMRGGSAETLLIHGCMRALTEERTNHLTSLLENYGDL